MWSAGKAGPALLAMKEFVNTTATKMESAEMEFACAMKALKENIVNLNLVKKIVITAVNAKKVSVNVTKASEEKIVQLDTSYMEL
jgi:hypothetical protein